MSSISTRSAFAFIVVCSFVVDLAEAQIRIPNPLPNGIPNPFPNGGDMNIPSPAEVLEKVRKQIQDLPRDAKREYKNAIRGMQTQHMIQLESPSGGKHKVTAVCPDKGKSPVYEFRCLWGNRTLDFGNDTVYAHNDLHGKPNQRWRVRKASTAKYDPAVRITCEANDLSLDMNLSSSRDLYLHSDHGGDNQRWLIIRVKGNIVRVVSCHETFRAWDTHMTNYNVYLHPSHGNRNQLWQIIEK